MKLFGGGGLIICLAGALLLSNAGCQRDHTTGIRTPDKKKDADKPGDKGGDKPGGQPKADPG